MKKITKIFSLSAMTFALMNPINALAMTKTETIYSNLDHSGSVKKTIVSTKLSELEKGEVVDYTNLDNLENVNGREKFSRDSSKVTWQSTGKDIYYQGKYNDSLPITVSAKYYLNDKEVNPKKIVGKKGSIKIVFKYTNKDFDYNSGMYVPYVVNMTSIMNGKNIKNINITSGRVTSTGTKDIVTSISAPGLYDSTGISEFKDLDEVVITYDTDSFEKNDFYFVITPKLLKEVDINNLDKITSIKGQIDTLQDGMNQVDDGSKKLNDGANLLNSGISKLSDGVSQLVPGSNQLLSGMQEMDNGIGTLSSSLSLINKYFSSISDSSVVLSEQELSLIPEDTRNQLAQIAYLYNLNNTTIQKLTETNNTLETTYNTFGLSESEETLIQNLPAILVQSGVDQSLVQSKITELITCKRTYEANKNLITLLASNNKAIISSNQSTMNTVLYYLNSMKEGSSKLVSGTQSLTDGISKLNDGVKEVQNGSKTLSSSTETLSSGISKLNSEGINKISDMGQKAVNYSSKVKKLVKLSKDYKGFASTNSSETIFIYKLSSNR